MKIESQSFRNKQTIPDEFAFCVPDAQHHVALGRNRNPHLEWSDMPKSAKSLALICVDTDVPTVGTDVNKEGRTVKASLPRCDFYHWVMIDIPPTCAGLKAGECSDGVTAGGGGSETRRDREARVREGRTTPTGSPATRKWAECIAATTAPRLRGTTSVCTIITSGSSPLTCRASTCPTTSARPKRSGP